MNSTSQQIDYAAELAKEQAINKALLAALQISTTTLETVYGNDRKNIAAKVCIERNRRAFEHCFAVDCFAFARL